MNAFLSIILASFFFISCKNEKHTIPLVSKPSEIAMVSKSFTGSEPKNCKGSYNCSEISIKTLFIEEKSALADSINSKILKTISDCLSTEEKPIEATNYYDIIKSFTYNYAKNKADLSTRFPNDSIIGWSANVQTNKAFQSDKLLNVTVNYYLFSGGAHGYNAIVSLLFDPKTGKIIPQSKLFSDIKKIVDIAEDKFRKNQKLDTKISLEEAGYFFENGVFKLSQNILFSKNGITLHYNQYEAASYAQGPINIDIPYSEIEKYLAVK